MALLTRERTKKRERVIEESDNAEKKLSLGSLSLFQNKSLNGLLSLLCLLSVLRLLSSLITAKSGFIAYTPQCNCTRSP